MKNNDKWETIRLGNLVKLNYGKGLPEDKREKGDIPVYGSSGITDWHNKKLIEGPSIIIGRKGTIGSVYYEDGPSFPIDTTYYIKPDIKNYELKYIYYLLSNSNLDKLNNDAAVPGLNRNFAYSQEFTIPKNIDIQKRLSQILSSFDKFININQHKIEILEGIAQLLYREWFIEFRFPGYEKVKFVDSELGIIPESWSVLKINDIIGYHIGGGWGQDEIVDNEKVEAYVIRGTDIPSARCGNFDKCPLRYHKESNFKSRVLKPNDIIFEVSGGSEGQPVGRSLFINEILLKAFNKPSICASFCKLIRLNNLLKPEIFYQFLNWSYKIGDLGRYQVQSTGISNFQFSTYIKMERIVRPDIENQDKFSNIVTPMLTEIQSLGLVNSYLNKIKNLLLPKLISGEIDISFVNIETKEN